MPSRPKITAAERVEAQRLLASGLSVGEIARRLGRHRTSIARCLARTTSRNTTSGGKRLQILLSDDEFAAFRGRATAHGLTLSDAGRRLVRHSEDVLDWPKERIAAVDRLRREVNAIGVNVNQMAQLAQSGRLVWNARDSATMARLEAKLDAVIEEMIRVVSIARMRGFASAVWDEEDIAAEREARERADA